MADRDGRNKPDPKIIEDAAEGPHGRLDDPNTPPETGPIERGRVDGGPTGSRQAGYRQAESLGGVGRIGLVGLAVILAVLVIAFVVMR
jgi:hypothetical protein